MATDKSYVEFVMEQLNMPDEVSCRAMMGEYVVYYKQKVIGGIYNNRFLIKPTKSAQENFPNAVYELPYEGAKLMILVENLEDGEDLRGLFDAMYNELPAPKPKKPKKA